ncbi:MAG TPA: nucleotide exchange factor GrpE [Myxococcales bacterium]|nr:nucleotide exchange factor GrpE [Myxococcales bacterium]
MGDSQDKPAGGKGHFEADVADDVIRAALESVERHSAKPAGELPVEVAVAAAEETVEEEAKSVEALTAELKETKATLELSVERAKETLERLKDTHERQLRAVADLDNYKKRAAREREEAEKFAIGKLVKELLPVLDNFDRALEHAGTAPDQALAQGIAATRKLLEDTLAKFGVKGFSAKGQPFDPNRHEAVQRVESAELPPNTVAQEIVRGYHLHDRLLRPAMVVVSTAPAAVPDEGGEESEAKGESAS